MSKNIMRTIRSWWTDFLGLLLYWTLRRYLVHQEGQEKVFAYGFLRLLVTYHLVVK